MTFDRSADGRELTYGASRLARSAPEGTNPNEAWNMLKHELGWYRYRGKYGNDYHHSGGLVNPSEQWTRTGIVHFEKGYDAILFTNSNGPDPVRVLIDAFEAIPA